MSVKFLKENLKINRVRPIGYKYPVGLSSFFTSILLTSNAATNTTGGTQTIDGTNTVHTFSSSPGSGTFTPSFTGNVEVLVVAGGGGSYGAPVNYGNGGGGAGGLIFLSAFPVITSSPYSVTVGAGGAALSNGSNSTFSSLTALGGGFGRYGPGVQGGSSSGADYQPTHAPVPASQPLQPGLSGSSGFGNAGGKGTDFPGSRHFGSGGGGAGGAGTNGWPGSGPAIAGPGGVGLQYSISGSATYYAGGGGGGLDSPTPTDAAGSGGNGGGGNGGKYAVSPGSNGTASRGGGAGGQRAPAGGSGGSGIVIIRYQTAQYQNTSGFIVG